MGGQFTIGVASPMNWIICARIGEERLVYRSTDWDSIHYSFSSSENRVEVFATSSLNKYVAMFVHMVLVWFSDILNRDELIHIILQAPPNSFGKPLYVPTSKAIAF